MMGYEANGYGIQPMGISSDLANQISSFTPNYHGNATLSIIGALILSNSQQVRISIIIIASFNIAAALAVILTILYDTRSARKQAEKYLKAIQPSGFWPKIHTAEVFPMVISTATIVQGTVFIVVQSGAMGTIFVGGCRKTAEIIWPAMWLVAYTMLIFGLETTFRSVRSDRFRARGRYATLACIAIIVLLVMATWIPSFLLPARDMCLGSLIWWTEKYALIGLILGANIILTFVLSAAVITTQLLRTSRMDRDERIAATRVVYYLGISSVIIALVIPYYIQIELKDRKHAPSTSHMAGVALNLSGLLNGFLYLFLRSNSDRFAIRSVDAPWGKRRRFRLFGPNDLNIGMHISTPMLLERPDSQSQLVSPRSNGIAIASPSTAPPAYALTSPRFLQTITPYRPMSQTPNPTPLPLSSHPTPTRPQSIFNRPPPPRTRSRYSIFPTRASTSAAQRTLSWSTTRSSNTSDTTPIIELPPPLFSRSHHRDASSLTADTSESIQIGFRFSHVPPPRVPGELHSREDSGSSTYRLPTQAYSPARQPSAMRHTHSSSDATDIEEEEGSDSDDDDAKIVELASRSGRPRLLHVSAMTARQQLGPQRYRWQDSGPPNPGPAAVFTRDHVTGLNWVDARRMRLMKSLPPIPALRLPIEGPGRAEEGGEGGERPRMSPSGAAGWDEKTRRGVLEERGKRERGTTWI